MYMRFRRINLIEIADNYSVKSKVKSAVPEYDRSLVGTDAFKLGLIEEFVVYIEGKLALLCTVSERNSYRIIALFHLVLVILIFLGKEYNFAFFVGLTLYSESTGKRVIPNVEFIRVSCFARNSGSRIDYTGIVGIPNSAVRIFLLSLNENHICLNSILIPNSVALHIGLTKRVIICCLKNYGIGITL